MQQTIKTTATLLTLLIVASITLKFTTVEINKKAAPHSIRLVSYIDSGEPGYPENQIVVSDGLQVGQEITTSREEIEIQVRTLFDVDGDERTGLAEIIYLLQQMAGGDI